LSVCNQWMSTIFATVYIDRLGYVNSLLSAVGLGGLFFAACTAGYLPRCGGSPTSLESLSCRVSLSLIDCCWLAVLRYCVDHRHSLAHHRRWYPYVECSTIIRRSEVAHISEIQSVENAADVPQFATSSRLLLGEPFKKFGWHCSNKWHFVFLVLCSTRFLDIGVK
jgi:hypothetical protein